MLCVDDLPSGVLGALLARYGLEVQPVANDAAIPGSYWGEDEAGLVGNSLFVRTATPVHSALHEACHFICMDAARRAQLNRDAGGDSAEENAVCYLQILLAEHIGMTRAQMCADMNAWGYTFRLGSADAWFERDAADAREWLRAFDLIDDTDRVTWKVREV